MRTLLLLFLLGGGCLQAQDELVRDFIKLHRKGEENVAVRLPGWLIGLASDIGTIGADDPDDRILLKLAGHLGTVRAVAYLNEDFTDPAESATALLRGLETSRGFERWADIRTHTGERVSLSVRYQKKKIREIVAIVREAERTVLVSSQAHLSAEELGRLINELEGV